MPINYTQLKQELQTDPTGMGYATVIGNYQALTDLLNAPRAGVTVEKVSVQPHELIASVTPTEYIALTQAQRDYLALLPALRTLDIRTGSSLRNALNAVFGPATTTRANYTALASRQGTRAEQLWGADTFVRPADIDQALSATG